MNITEDLARAYFLTNFRVFTPTGSFTVHVRRESTELAVLHASHNARSSAFLTAYSPFSQPTDAETDRINQNSLQTEVEGRWEYLLGEGVDPTGEWPAEPSLLILGIDLDEALVLGQKFDQLALLFATGDGSADLYTCNPEDQVCMNQLLDHIIRFQ